MLFSYIGIKKIWWDVLLFQMQGISNYEGFTEKHGMIVPTWDLITWSSKNFLKSVQTKLFLPHVADAYLEPCRTSKMEVFAKIVSGFLEIPEN